MNTTSANLNSAAAINALTERANAAIDAAVDKVRDDLMKNNHKPLPGKCGIWNGSQVATAFISYLPNALKPMQISLKDSIIHTKVKT